MFFEKTWRKIFPDAFSIIIQRDPHYVARSLMRSKLFQNYNNAIHFHKVMNEKILLSANENTLIIKYDDLKNEINKIVKFIPLNITDAKISLAKSIVQKEQLIRLNKSISYNIKNILAEAKIILSN